MRIEWLSGAFDDLDRLETFLRQQSPLAADRLFLEIADALRILEDFPQIGRLAPDVGEDFREYLVPVSSSGYVVLYMVRDAILVVRIRHQRENEYPATSP
ncbi:MAG TPA: type II toxin-antitoxin system RelE/ParE family toxin [Devosia sp.]|nr:type II toxin-antitoxin system RelE/ParE family toxin [Devosia sp.]